MLEGRYNKLYSVTSSEVFYACSMDCEMCELWRRPGNTWKVFVFFPFHCHLCEEAGYADDFYLVMRKVFVCESCYRMYRRRMDTILHRRLK